MGEGSSKGRKWHASAHARLCLLGWYLRLTGFFRPLEEGVKLRQKVLKYTAVQKLEMLLVSLLAVAQALAHSGRMLRAAPARRAAFGLPGCADGRDVQDLRRGVEAPFVRCSHARRHDRDRAVLLLDLDLSPLPASGAAAGSERCSMGRCRSKTGRKLVRGRASQYQATVWEEVLPGRTVEPLAVVQQAVQAAERLLDLEGDGE